jgi:hypothetical protein
MCTPSRRLLSRTFKFASSAGAIAAVFALAGAALTQESLKRDKDEVFTLHRAVPIPGNPPGTALVSFDISWFDADPSLNNYYLADRSNKSVDVIHSGSSTVTHQFMPGFVGARATLADGTLCSPVNPPTCTSNNDVSGPDGVLTVDHKELWVGDGDSRVWVLNPTTGALAPTAGAPNPIPTSPTGTNHKRADEMCYDPADHLVMAANNADVPPFVSLISTQTYTVVVPGGKIVFDGNNGTPAADGIEQCQWSPRTGKFYISIPQLSGKDPGVGAVAVIDPKTKKVVAVFPIPVEDCAAPQGMAVGPDSQILLGCNGQFPDGQANTVIINEHSGAIIRTLRGLGGNDEVWFNPGDGHYFLAEGQLPVPPGTEQLGIVDSAGKRPDKAVVTANNPGGTTRRAHSVAADPGANEVYVPIPANTTGFSSPLCSDPTKGCVAVFGPVGKDDHPRTVQEREPDDRQE